MSCSARTSFIVQLITITTFEESVAALLQEFTKHIATLAQEKATVLEILTKEAPIDSMQLPPSQQGQLVDLFMQISSEISDLTKKIDGLNWLDTLESENISDDAVSSTAMISTTFKKIELLASVMQEIRNSL